MARTYDDDDDPIGPAGEGHNSDDSDTYRVAANELQSFIERHERLEEEKQEIADQQKEIMSEAKARGYDTKAMRKIMQERKRDKDDLAEEQAVLEMYRQALGMA